MDPLRFLALVRARLVRALLVEGAARVSAIALTAAVLAVAADFIWHLPGAVRLALLGGVVAAAGAIAWTRLVRPFRRDLGDRDLARFVERRAPQLGGRLLTRVEGIALGAADDARLAEILAAIDPRSLVPARRTPRQLLITGSAMLVVLIAVAASPATAWDGLRRLALPLGGAEWRRHTALSASLEHEVAPADGALTIRIERRHPDPQFSAPVTVTWRGGRVDETRQLGGLTGTSWSTSIAAPPGTYAITVASADAEPVTLTGRIVTRPTVARMRATIAPPAYTGLPAQQADTLAGSVVPGTTITFAVTFAVEAGREIVNAAARFGDQPVELTKGDSGWVGRIAPTAAGVLAIEARDQDGIALAGEPRFPLTITPDRAPVVSLSGPAPRETVTVRAVVEIAVAASDDFALGEVDLRGRTVHTDEVKPGAAPTARPDKPQGTGEVLERFSGVAGQASVTRSSAVEIGRHAAEGEQLVVTGRAADRNDVSGPGIAESDPIVLRVVAEDVLRQELDRLLGEAKERITQGRDDLAAAADDRARRLRSATQASTKAEELLAQVIRRWDQNRLAADGIGPGRAARTVITDAALPRLAEAAAGSDEARTKADAALAEAERLLGSILQEGDLTRLLTSLIARQTAVATETKGFALAFLTKPLDGAGKALQANLATRQRELADQALDLERRLLAKEGSAWTKAQDLVRKEGPGDRLRQAGQDVATNDKRPNAVKGQQAALGTLQKLLDALRGGDAAKDLGALVGKIAMEQERLAHELERGAPPGSLVERQKDLLERTKAAVREAETKDPEAAKLLQGANDAQQSAQGGMSAGNSTAATRDANAAAGLLREAQKKLGGESPQKPDEEKKKDGKIDILALLKELRTLQASLVTDATLLDRTLGEKAPDFAAQRQVQALARSQGDVHLRLTEEAIKPLEKNPVALLALERVDTAMGSTAEHLGKPALGAKGVRLARNALVELTRLIEVAEDMPPPDKKDGGPQGGGPGGGQAPSAPFPPQAEIALLAAMQQELALRTAAGHPEDLGKAQERLQKLVESLARTTRPDTRPAILLERSRRAMTSAAFELARQERGPLTRNEQQAAEAALRRLLAETDGGGGGGGQQQKPPPPQQSSNDGRPPPPAGGDGQQSPAPPTAGGNQQGTPGQVATLPVQTSSGAGDLMQLPPQIREQIRQAREQQFTPGQLQVYQRYLELLEAGK